MRRRTFIGLIGGAAAGLPLSALAQRSDMPVIGFLSSRSASETGRLLETFRQGLRQEGFVDGQSCAIEARWAEGHYERLGPLARDLVRRPVTAIAATGGDPSALAAKAATSKVPIVFTTGSDPVKAGLVSSLNRPGGNLTGISFLVHQLGAKRLQLLREMVPSAQVIGLLVNPTNPGTADEVAELEAAARSVGLRIQVFNADSGTDFEAMFDAIVRHQVGAILIGNDPFIIGRRDQLVRLSARHAVPAIAAFREYTAAGGLISYGASIADVYRQAGTYVGRILKGVKPADLPVLQPTKFEFVVNARTAQVLGLTIPRKLLPLIDDVIE